MPTDARHQKIHSRTASHFLNSSGHFHNKPPIGGHFRCSLATIDSAGGLIPCHKIVSIRLSKGGSDSFVQYSSKYQCVKRLFLLKSHIPATVPALWRHLAVAARTTAEVTGAGDGTSPTWRCASEDAWCTDASIRFAAFRNNVPNRVSGRDFRMDRGHQLGQCYYRNTHISIVFAFVWRVFGSSC